MTAIDTANFCIGAVGLTISIIGIILTRNAIFMEKWVKGFFAAIFSIIVIYALSSVTSLISLALGSDGSASLTAAAIFFESLSSSLLMPILSVFIICVCGQSLKTPFFYIILTLWLIYFVLLSITQFTTFIYYVTPDNTYARGPLYPILLIPPVLLMAVNVIALFLRKEHFSKRIFRSMLYYILFPTVAMIIQMFSYGILIIVLGTTIASLILFFDIMNDQFSKAMTQSREISAQQLSIRTLQMRPHFIYNTLSNIYYLCEQDPRKAQAAIDDFTKYLRKNFTAITSESLIPFEEELEHARAYLAVVKVRFEDMLFVTYDTQFTSFRLPPLTLEPIVENAVKHGLDPDSAPLNITISTVKRDDKVIIKIENTGTDYDGAGVSIDTDPGENKQPHIGLSNVKSRLADMCSGSLVIEPREEGGTTVTITIPL